MPIMQTMIKNQKGFTLLEVMVAMVILVMGATLLFYNYNTSAQFSVSNRERREALQIAENEMERLRLHPSRLIEDSMYIRQIGFGKEYQVAVQVMNEEIREELGLNYEDTLELIGRPSEFKVNVYLLGETEFEYAEDIEEDPIVSLKMMAPDYYWY